ncbi:hypothetical protein FER11_18190 [Escherichia coli]|nr:hypothetical protein [Escherichia coli]
MVDYNSLVLEGLKILFFDKNNEFVKKLYDPLINILCIEDYYFVTGIYDSEDASKQIEKLKKAINDYRFNY